MRILTRYLLRTHAGPFVFALCVLTGLLFVNTVARRIKDLAGKGLEVSIILEVLGLSLPHIVALTLPMAVLVAVLYAFSQLAADNEITALKASGTNLVRLTVPLMIAGVLLAAAMVWFNDRVLPESNHYLRNLLSDVGRKTPTFELKEQIINPIRTADMSSNYFLQAGSIEHASGRLRDVVIYDLSGQTTRTVYADSGYMAFNELQTDLLLRLFDGVIYESEVYQTDEFDQADYHEYLLVMKGVGDEFTRASDSYRGDREMNIGMLRANADSALGERAKTVARAFDEAERALLRALAGPTPLEGDTTPDYRPAAVGRSYLADLPFEVRARSVQIAGSDEVAHRAAVELSALESQANSQLRTANLHRVEYHKKFAIPFACIVFVLLGAPIAVRFPRGGVGMVIAISLMVFGIYYMSLIGGETLGDRGVVPPFLGPWGPNIVFLAIGIWGIARIGRETATSRGGGWDDLWMTLRGILTRPFRHRPRSA
jgi:lipopolysaccharide export system permease protein